MTFIAKPFSGATYRHYFALITCEILQSDLISPLDVALIGNIAVKRCELFHNAEGMKPLDSIVPESTPE